MKVLDMLNSIPWTFKLDALGQFQVSPTVEQKLRDDMVKVLESACGDKLVDTDFIAVCSATNSVVFTTNGTATASATADLTAANVRSIVDYLKKKLVPPYGGTDYLCIASISALSGMHADTGAGGWQDVSKYTAEYAKNIFNGEIGRFYMARFVEENGYLSNTIGNGSTHGAAVFMGADSLYEAVSVPEDIRVKIPEDYGRSQGLAWYALLGFQLVWSYSTDSEQHVLYVTSA